MADSEIDAILWVYGGFFTLIVCFTIWISLEGPRVKKDQERHCKSQVEISYQDCKTQPLKYYYP